MRLFDKTVNVRLLAILLLSGAVLGCGIHWLHGVQSRRQAGLFLDRADEAIEKGHLADASGYLKRYVLLRPDDVDALEKLGLLEIDRGLFAQAYGRLEKTLRKDPDRTEIRRKLINLAIKSGHFSDAKQHISPKFFPQSYQDNKLRDAELLVMLATCQASSPEADRGVADARQSLQSAIELEPDRLDAYRLLASLLRRKLDDRPGADRVMDEMVERNQSSAESLVVRAEYLLGLSQFEAARDDATEALKSEPAASLDSASEQPDSRWVTAALWVAAQSCHRLGQLDEARAHAERGIAVQPRLTVMYNLLAQIALQSANPREAIAVVNRGLERNPGNPDLLWNLATISIQSGNPDSARDAVDLLKEIENLAHPIELPEGQIACLRGQWGEGRKKLEMARAKVLDKPDLAKQVEFWLGSCYGQSGRTSDQLAAFQRAIQLDPKWVPPRLAKANVHIATRQLDMAITEYQDLRRIEGRARFKLARLLAEKNRYLKPESRDWQAIEALLDELRDEEQSTVGALILRAECLSQREAFEAAEKLLAAGKKKWPQNVEIRRVQGTLLQKQGKWAEVEELFRAAGRDLGNSAALQLGLAGLLVRQFGDGAADRLHALADETQGLSELEQTRLWRGLMVLSFASNDLEEVQRLYQLAAKKAPKDAIVQRLMFEVAIRKTDRDAIEQVLTILADIPGQEAFWHYGQAVRQQLLAGRETNEVATTQEYREKALEHLTQAETLDPSREDQARIFLLGGDIHFDEGRQAEALDRYLAAFRLGGVSMVAMQRAVHLLNQQARYEEADRLLDRLDSTRVASDPVLSRYSAESLLRDAEDGKALEKAEAIAADSKDYQDHLWLAQFRHLSAIRAQARSGEESLKMLGKAEESYRKATQLGRDSPAAWVPLIRFLLQSDRSEEAQTAFAEMRKKMPADGAPYELAVCYDMLGQPDQSKSELAKIIEQGAPRFPQARVNWARRKLASILLRRLDYQILQQAEQLLRENLASEAESVLDKRALATVLSVHADPAKRQEAIGLLEELVKTTATPQDRFALAKLDLARGNWLEASRGFRRAAVESDNPEYIAAYVGALLDHDQLSDATSWLKRLVELAPGQFDTVRTQARVLWRNEEVDQAIGVIEDFAGAPKATGHQTLALASFLGKNGRASEALALIEGVLEDAAPANLIIACTNVARGGGLTPAHSDRIETWVKTALEGKVPAAGTLLILADLRIVQERFDDVEVLYRQALDVDGENLIALNNLAVLLALKKKNLDEAVDMIDKAIEIGGPSGTLLDSRATVYLAGGQANEALDSMLKAIARTPKHSRYFHLAQVQERLGNSREVKKALDEARKLGISPQMLHPLERPEYARLMKTLDP